MIRVNALEDKGHAIKGFDVSLKWDLGPLDLLEYRAIACYQLSSEICFVCVSRIL